MFYVDDYRLKNYLSYMSVDEFLNLNDVGLIVFVSCRSAYFDIIVDFLRSALNLSVPVLFVPASTEEFNPIFTYFGFKLSALDEFLFNFSSSVVVDHPVTRGVFRVGVKDRCSYHFVIVRRLLEVSSVKFLLLPKYIGLTPKIFKLLHF